MRAVPARRHRLQSRGVTEQIVLLAAGLGSRLGSAEAGVPKPLAIVAGQPLVAHALAHAEASGCREAVVVIGYEARRVRAAVEALETSLVVRFVEIENPSAPNGHSLLAAEACARPMFFLQMVDHVFSEPVLARLDRPATHDGEAARLLVDPRPEPGIDLVDATKVSLSDDRITAIGKGLRRWDALDTGCFRLTTRVFEALRMVPAGEPRTVSAAMRRLVADGAMRAVTLDGVRWVDVDTPDDRAFAEQMLATAAIGRP